MLFFGGECSVAFVEGSTDVVNACADGDMAACDFPYQDSAFGSVYEAYGASCGGRSTQPLDGTCLSASVS